MKLQDGLNNNPMMKMASPKAKRSFALQEAWEKIATPLLLEHTDNVIDSNKKANSLVIFVDDAQWCAQLSMNKEYYRSSFHYLLNEEVDDIFFVVSKKTGIKKNFKKREQEVPWYQEKVEPVKLSDSELDYLRRSVDKIEDPKLKETLFEAAVTDLEWKKGLKAIKKP